MARFIDEATITVISGHGGPGAVCFHREKYVQMGGPAGGEGGRGGDVWVVGDSNLGSLMDLRYKRKYTALNGQTGGSGNKTGLDGEDLFIRLPIGAVITDAETNGTVFEVVDDQSRFRLVAGGRGGKGNAHFKTSVHQAPRFAQPGEDGQTRQLKVELKLLADVGIVGYPNAGKSTLISKISAARPKIADYPFTTLVPNLGVVRLGHDRAAPTFIVADVPGLIAGSSLGRGKGTKFLRHLERTRLLVHLIDGAKLLKEFGPDASAIAAGVIRDREIIDAELYTFGAALAERPQILALNKCDLYDATLVADIQKKLARRKNYKDVYFISAAAHQGLDILVKRVAVDLFRIKGQTNVTKVLLPSEVPIR